MTMSLMAGADRRSTSRLRTSELPPDLWGRVRPGYTIRVIELSARGALIESSRRLIPGTGVELHIECANFRHATRATVVRCFVGALYPHRIVFRGAVEFDRRLERWCLVDPVVHHPRVAEAVLLQEQMCTTAHTGR
jgi:hypothetical protein